MAARATVTGSITIDGASLQVTIPAGENAAISFAGTAGQKLGLGLSSVSGPTRTVTIQNGNTILAAGGVGSSGAELDVTLPVNASYTIILSAASTASGSLTLTLSTDVTVSLPVDGDSPQVAMTRPGRNARLTFTGAVGDHLGLAVSQKSGGSFVLTLLKPTGSIVMGSTTTPPVNEFDLDLLQDGGYTIFIDPTGPATSAATFTLSRDVQAGIVADYDSVPITINRLGQNASLNFSANAGDRLGIGLSGSTIPQTYVTLVGPAPSNNRVGSLDDGMTYFIGPNGRGELDSPLWSWIPETGTYRIVVDPDPNSAGAATGSITVTLSHDVEQAIQVGGPAVTFPMSRLGQNGRAFIQLLQGQSLQITYSNVATQFEAQLRKPDGTVFKWAPISPGVTTTWTTAQIGPVPVTGQYQLRLDPWQGSASAATVKIDGSPGYTSMIYGFANVGETLVAAAESLQPAADSITYQWQRCDTSGASCADLPGQTSVTYTIQQADLTTTLRVREVATNGFGSTTVTSAPTPIVLRPIAELANDYRPFLKFQSGNPSDPDSNPPEHWRPISVDHLLGEAQAWQVHAVCPNHTDVQFCERTYGAGSLATFATSDAALDIAGFDYDPRSYVASNDPDCYSGALPGELGSVWECNGGPTSVLYYKYGQDATGYRYIDYWIFYRFNDVTGLGSVDRHEGDWEGATVALSPIPNPVDPPIADVLFAAHSAVNWIPAVNLVTEPGAPHHPVVYVARGTHASYPDACPSDCHQPPNSDWPWESPHSGGAAWDNNSLTDCACTVAFPVGSGSWTYWPGSWGFSEGESIPGGGSVGFSPRSPGGQSRFQCAATGYSSSGCQKAVDMFARRGRSDSVAAAPPSSCRSWMRFEVSALACDPGVLTASIAHHSMNRPSQLRLSARARRAGGFPGLVQIVGQPFRNGETIAIRGRASAHMTLFVFVSAKRHEYRLAASFRTIGMSGTREVRVDTVHNRPVLRMGRRTIKATLTKLR